MLLERSTNSISTAFMIKKKTNELLLLLHLLNYSALCCLMLIKTIFR